MSDAAFLPRARRKRLGLTPRQERTFNLLAAALISAMVLGWAVSISDQYLKRQDLEETTPTPGRMLASKLSDPRAPETAYLDDAQLDFLDTLRGRSGKLQAAFRAPGDTLTSPKDPRAPEMSARFEAPSGSFLRPRAHSGPGAREEPWRPPFAPSSGPSRPSPKRRS